MNSKIYLFWENFFERMYVNGKPNIMLVMEMVNI